MAVCVFITAVPITKLFAWGEGDSRGHVLRETTSRGLCGLVCPSRNSERHGVTTMVIGGDKFSGKTAEWADEDVVTSRDRDR